MLTRGLVHNDSLIFDGTNYDVWKIRMLKYFRVMDPNMERIVDMGFSPPKDPQNLSLEDEKNSHLKLCSWEAHQMAVALYEQLFRDETKFSRTKSVADDY